MSGYASLTAKSVEAELWDETVTITVSFRSSEEADRFFGAVAAALEAGHLRIDTDKPTSIVRAGGVS